MGTTGTRAGTSSKDLSRSARLRRWSCLAIAIALILGITPVAAGATCVSTPAGLIARWPGDDSSADVAHGRNGTLVGGTTYTAGKVGQAFSFDGADGTVSVPDSRDWNLSGDFTIDTWVSFNGFSWHSQALVAHDQGSGPLPKWVFWYTDRGELDFHIGTGSGYSPVSAAWSPNLAEWYHVAITRSGSDYALYLNGNVVDTGTETVTIPDAASPLTLGWGETDWFLNGLLDEPEIYQRALSATEIKAIYDSGGTARCAITRSDLSLTGPATAYPSETVTMNGTLQLSDGASVDAETVAISRQTDGGSWVALPDVTTEADGSFSFQDEPGAGTVVYRATFAGATDVSAGNGWSTVEVGKGTSVLMLSVTKTRLTYGDHITLTAHLEGGSSNRVVAIYAVRGGQDKTIRKDRVNHEGDLSVRAAPSETTTYYASYAGDPKWNADTSPSKTVRVAARWAVKTVGGYATRGGVRLYHYSPTCDGGTGKGCPTAVFTLGPNHAGERVSFEGKYCRDGRCFKDAATFRLNRRSQASIYISYGDRTVIGWTLFFRLKFGGDADHVRSASAWAKTKVTS
jgi:hypothetical protein